MGSEVIDHLLPFFGNGRRVRVDFEIMTFELARRLFWFVPFLSLLWPRPSAAQETERWEGQWEAPWERGTFTTPSCSLDLRLGRRTRNDREELWGLAVVVIPFSGCWRPRLRGEDAREELAPSSGHASQDERPRLLLAGAPEGEGPRLLLADAPVDEFALPPTETSELGAPREDGGPSREVGPPPRRLTPALLREVVRRALHAGGFEAEERTLDDMKSRARLAGLLPELRLRGALGVDQTRSLAGSGFYPGDLTTRDGLDSAAEVRLTFRLNRLLYDDVEPGLARLRLQITGARQKLVERTLDWLFVWERNERKRQEPDLDDESRLDAELRASEAALRLHEITGGWFLSAIDALGEAAAARGKLIAAPRAVGDAPVTAAAPREEPPLAPRSAVASASVELPPSPDYARRAPWSPTSSSSVSKIPRTPPRRAVASSP